MNSRMEIFGDDSIMRHQSLIASAGDDRIALSRTAFVSERIDLGPDR